MKNRELILLYRSLDRLGRLSGVRFAYAVSRNISLLEPTVKSLEKVLEASPEYLKFDEARVELAKKHSTKDEKGNPKTENNGFIISDIKAFEKEFEKLRKDNKELIEKRDKQVKEYNELLDLEGVFTPHKLKLADVPVEITVAELHGIQPIIEE